MPSCDDPRVKSSAIFASVVARFLCWPPARGDADAFLAEGHSVIGIDNTIGWYLDNLPPDLAFCQIDCNDCGRVREHMRRSTSSTTALTTVHQGLSM
jgi:hypothetical protein